MIIQIICNHHHLHHHQHHYRLTTTPFVDVRGIKENYIL